MCFGLCLPIILIILIIIVCVCVCVCVCVALVETDAICGDDGTIIYNDTSYCDEQKASIAVTIAMVSGLIMVCHQ